MRNYVARHDNEFGNPIINSFDKNQNPSDRLLIESVHVNPDVQLADPVIPDDEGPPDPLTPGEKTAKQLLQLRYRVLMNSLKPPKPASAIPPDPQPCPGVTFEGQDWTLAEDGTWNAPFEVDNDAPSSHSSSYEDAASFSKFAITKMASPSSVPTPTSPPSSGNYQSDTGANASCTNDISLLHDVTWIEPILCTTANVGSDLQITAIGRMSLTCGKVFLPVIVYYSENAPGTIISPNAICRQFNSSFYGYQKRVNFDHCHGDIRFNARDGLEDVTLQVTAKNDLWYHSDIHIVKNTDDFEQPTAAPSTDPSSAQFQPRINFLSDSAKFELWHQRLAHIGKEKLESLHKYCDGVPKLRGNAFYRCPTCLSSKLCTKNPVRNANLGTSNRKPDDTPADDPTRIPVDSPIFQSSEWDQVDQSDDIDGWEAYLDELHLPDTKAGMNFHADFGFVRGSDFRLKTESGKTITSIDGKNSYCLIVDRATRFIWVYIGDSKEPPVQAVRMILAKFGAKNATHRTFRTDRDRGLNLSDDFRAMLELADFTVELTGPDSSDQNAVAERPHRDLGQMMRCLLHSSGLGPEYWSFAMQHAVFVKNRIPHSKLGTTPFQAFTGRRPNLSRCRVFGSRVYVRTTGDKPAKLDYHTNQGIFLSFCATDSNIYYIDDKSGSIRTGRHVLFDEAHMTVPAAKAPFAAQALQRLGYYVRESWIDTSATSEHKPDLTNSMQIERLTSTAIVPARATEDSIGFDLHLDLDTVTVQPNSTSLLPTGIAAKAPAGTYLRIAPRSGLTVKRDVDTLAGVVDPDFTGNIVVVLRNFGSVPQIFSRGDKIAQLIVEQATTPSVQLVTKLATTVRADSGFGSTDAADVLLPQDFTKAPPPPVDPLVPPLKEPPDTTPLSFSERLASKIKRKTVLIPTYAAAAATLNMDSFPLHFPDDAVKVPIPSTPSVDLHFSKVERIANDIHLAFEMPYDIGLSSSPFDNQTSRDFQVFGTDPLLGIDLEMCSNFGLPQLKQCKKSTPCARIPRWRSELRGAYVTHVNNVPVPTIDSVRQEISKARLQNVKLINIGFATISKQSMHSQKGIPQMYHDQMNVIGKHLWELSNDPEWTEDIENALPLLECVRKDQMDLTPADRKKLLDLLSITSLKKQRKLTRRILQGQADWHEWQASEFKQLDQYEDQHTFGEPQERPHGSNLLNLIWCYMIKDDGRKKARCVCNGAKNMRGSVTLAETYASSLEQNAARVFWATTALKNWKTIGADAGNAFAEADAPVAPLYVRIDEQYREWYSARYPDRPKLSPHAVMRVKKALQGHPESPRLWAKLIDEIIRNLNLKPCTHEPNLYYTNNYKGTGKEVLFLRQVDDFAISCEDDAVSKDCIQAINSKMTIEVKELGIISRFNGIDVDQTRDYIKLSNATYIDKILRNHPWILEEHPPATFPIPMRSDTAYTRSLEEAEALSEPDLLALETKLGFSYRQAIGELIYALVTCRPDISFAAIKLSQYSASPALCHFNAVKDIFRFLKATKDDGIYYWRSEPRLDLPQKVIPPCKPDENYDELSIPERQDCNSSRLVAAVDSDHAGDVSHRKSVSGIVIKLAGGAVLYKTAYQATIAQSSTEAEFTAAADAAKYILYLRSLLEEIGLLQEDATVLYEDNQGALLMANAQRPTKRTRHMDIKTFGLQDWVKRDLLCLKRIATADNYSDAMTKNVGRTLFYRHMNFIMGRIVPAYAYKRKDITFRVLYDKHASSLDSLQFLSREDVKGRYLIPIGVTGYHSRSGIRPPLQTSNDVQSGLPTMIS